MDTNGSIRNSEKASRTSFRPSSVEPALLGLARQFLESYTFDMIRIRQQLYPEKMEQAVSRNTYYVLGNEQRFEPGFLVCMKDKPLVFMKSRLNYGFTLRLRDFCRNSRHGPRNSTPRRCLFISRKNILSEPLFKTVCCSSGFL